MSVKAKAGQVRRAAAIILLAAGAWPARSLAHSSPSTETATTPMTIERLVADALLANPEVRIDEVRIGEARSLHRRARAQAYPRGSLTALFGGPTPEAKTTELNNPMALTAASFENDFNFGDLGVAFRVNGEAIQPLFTFGKLGAAQSAAQALVDAAGNKVDITRGEVITNVHRAFWAYQLAEEFASSLEEGAGILASVLQKVEELLESDSPQVTENDRLRLTHAHATVLVRLSEARNASELALRALRLLTGRPQTTPLVLEVRAVEEIPRELPPIAELIAEAVEHRPELRALRSLVDAHRKWALFQALGYWPDVFIGGFIKYASTTSATDQTSPFVKDELNFFDAGIGLGVRLELDFWGRAAGTSQAEAQLATRMAEAAAAAAAIDLEVRKLHGDMASGYERIDRLERALRAARGWLNASVLAYDVAAGDAGELIDAFIARATAEGELKKTSYDVQTGMIDLLRAAGLLVDRARAFPDRGKEISGAH